jgi:hypothetical protein
VCWIALVVGLVYFAVMVVVILEGYAIAGTGGAALGIATVAWATRAPARLPTSFGCTADGSGREPREPRALRVL